LEIFLSLIKLIEKEVTLEQNSIREREASSVKKIELMNVKCGENRIEYYGKVIRFYYI
jgi:hypothetical protein